MDWKNYGHTYISPFAYIGPFCIIGYPPESLPFDKEAIYMPGQSTVIIRSGVVLTGLVTVDAGKERPTLIEDDCFIMKHCHIGHDAYIMHNCILSPGAKVGGHSFLWPHVNMGMNAVIHQQVTIPPGVMIGMGATITKSAAEKMKPFCIYIGAGHYLRENTYLIDKLGEEEVRQLTYAWESRTK